jgi:hypothetical protein
MSVSVGRPERHAPPQAGSPKREWGSLFFTVVAVVGAFHALLMVGLETGRWIYTRGEVARLEAEIGVLQAQTYELEAIAEHRYDPVFREQLARAQGFIRPDETRVVTRAPSTSNP